MASAALPKRIQKETERLQKEPVQGISAEPHEDNLRYFKVTIEGPKESPYEGGTFHAELFLPDDYPMTAPKIRFLTPIYHPNIDRLGRICLDVLKSISCPPLTRIRNRTALLRESFMGRKLTSTFVMADNWSPALQIRTILLSIQALLGAPNPDDPLANDVAQHWKADEPKAIEVARDWTREKAMGK